jgi:S-adenosylmethionine:tRNA-ribosyltransferase-isomerase (queuine synthetase)
MQIKIILLILICLFGVLFFVYREGYDKGFTTAIGQIQTQNAKHVDTVIKKANDVVMNDEKVIDKFITTQAEFIKSVEVVSMQRQVDRKPHQAASVAAKKESKHETNNVVRVVGIDDDELYELQRLTRAANAH